MKALSIRQPWAWLILDGGKDIENRNWKNAWRGRVLIHAAKGMTLFEYNAVARFLAQRPELNLELPLANDLPRGCIVGSIEIVDCVSQSGSPWFMGDYGFVLKDPRPLPFIPYRGQLGFFEVPDHVVAEVRS